MHQADGPDLPAVFRRAAEFVDQVFKGAKPVDLPVEQATRHELDIDLNTAKAPGGTIPNPLLACADEAIR